MGKKITKKFYVDNFEEELKKRGLTQTAAALGIGCSASYFSNPKRAGEMPLQAIKSLESTFNIQPETYLVPEKEEPKTEPVDFEKEIWFSLRTILARAALLVERTEPENIKKLITEAFREL